MSKSLTAAAVLSLTFAAATEARAQETNRIGLLMGVPALVGFDWELSERVGLRPDFSFTLASSTRALSAGLSGVFYVRRWDALRVYVSPRFSHTLNRNVAGGGFTTTTSSASGSLGGQYALASRFSIFAEVGAAYTHSRQSSNASTNAIANRSAVGAILFF
jgi:hypothetical protein